MDFYSSVCMSMTARAPGAFSKWTSTLQLEHCIQLFRCSTLQCAQITIGIRLEKASRTEVATQLDDCVKQYHVCMYMQM